MIKRIMFKGINYFTNRMLTLFIDNVNHFNLLSELCSNSKHLSLLDETNIQELELSSGEIFLYRDKIYSKLAELILDRKLVVKKEFEYQTQLLSKYEEIANSYRELSEKSQVIIETSSPYFVNFFKNDEVFIVKQNGNIGYADKFNIHTYGCELDDILFNIFEKNTRNQEVRELINKIVEDIRINNSLNRKDLNKLLEYIGNSDSAILRINHQIMMLKRKGLFIEKY